MLVRAGQGRAGQGGSQQHGWGWQRVGEQGNVRECDCDWDCCCFNYRDISRSYTTHVICLFEELVQHSTCLLLPPTSRLSESANYNTNSSIIYPTIAHIYIHPQFLTEVRRGLIAKHLGHFPICAPSSPNQLVVLHLSRHAQPSVGLLVEDTQLLQVHLVSDTK